MHPRLKLEMMCLARGSWPHNRGALIVRIRFRGPLYYNYNKEPQNSIGNYLGPYSYSNML